ncbi:MAG: M56 family metallopeptidase [Bacteroidota bacterium]
MKYLLAQNGEFLSGLGHTILHSLWLVTIIAAVAFTLLKSFKLTAKEKYDVVFAAQLLSFASVILLFFWSQNTVTSSVVLMADHAPVNQVIEPIADESEMVQPSNAFLWNGFAYSRYLGCFWLAGLLLLSVWRFMSWRFTMRLRNTGLLAIPENWQERFNQMVERMNFSRKVAIHTSTKVVSPIMIGYLKPLILVPMGFFSDLAPAEIEAVILHELAHIKRKDYLHLFIQQIINLIMFYHPAIWLLDKMAKQERENACDDYVVDTTGDPKTYVKALGTLQLNFSKTQNKMAMNLLNDKNDVLNRLKRLLGEEPRQKVGGKFFVLPVILLISLVLLSFSSEKATGSDNSADQLVTDYLIPDHSAVADTSIIVEKPVKIKEKRQKEKNKTKVVEVKKPKKSVSELIVVEELPAELVEVIVEQPEQITEILADEEVSEIAIVEEVPELFEVIVEEPPVIPDTVPGSEREELLIVQLKELRERFERLQLEKRAEVNEKEREKLEKARIELAKAQYVALEQRAKAESEKHEALKAQQTAELAKLRAETMQKMAMLEKEKALNIKAKISRQISYEELITKMNEDGLKVKQGEKIKLKVQEQSVYFDGKKLSDKLSSRYRELLWGYIRAGIKTGSATIIMTPNQTDITFKKN